MVEKRIVLATRNAGKVREFRQLMAGLPVTILSLVDFPDLPEIPETGNTFRENALIKARSVKHATGLIAVADDSGLEVDALNGAPGVYSARFAGEPKDDSRNNAKLLALLKDVPWEARTARYRCVIAIVTPEGQEHIVEGSCEGLIGYEPRGTHGFGYDPLFFLPAYEKTMAELDPAVKNLISHRARAFQKAATILQELLK